MCTHGLVNNTIICTHGTAGQVANTGTIGNPDLYISAGDSQYVTFLITGTQRATTGTFNVFQGTTSAGGSAKAVSGASLVTTTTGTAFAIEVNTDQLDVANNYTFLNCVGTIAASGTFWGQIVSVQTNVRRLPGSGFNGSVLQVA